MIEDLTENEIIFLEQLYDISYDYFSIIMMKLEEKNYKYLDKNNLSMFEKDIMLKLSMYLLTVYLINEGKYTDEENNKIHNLQIEMMVNYHIYNLKKEYLLDEKQINDLIKNTNDYLEQIELFIHAYSKSDGKRYTYFSVPALIFGLEIMNKKYIKMKDVKNYIMTEEQKGENENFLNALLESGDIADRIISNKIDDIVKKII